MPANMSQPAMLNRMSEVSRILGVTGNTLSDVRERLLAQGMTEYQVYLTVKGAALLYPHVQEVLSAELSATHS